MTLASLLSQWLSRGSKGAQRQRRGKGARPVAAPRRTRLWLEALEDRLAPAQFTVINNLDAGAGSLRNAIDQANASVGVPDNIVFAVPAGQENIAIASNDTNNPFAFGPTGFVITDNLTIMGNSTGTGITIDGGGTRRVFGVTAGDTLTLQFLTIQGGNAVGGAGGNSSLGHGGGGGGGGAGLGGAIFNNGTVNIIQSTLNNNTAQGGNGGSKTTVSGFNGGGGGGGGGSSAFAGGDASGPLGGGGGGVRGAGDSSGNGGMNEAGISATPGSNGTAGGGGGETGNGTATSAGGFGGGGGGGSNTTGAGGAGGFGAGGGGGPHTPGQIGGAGGFGGGGGGDGGHGTQGLGGFGGGDGGASSASGSGGGGGGGLGGAIFNNQGATLNVTNSTIADNTAQGGAGGTGALAGGAGSGLGGGIFNRNGTVTILNSTISDNTAEDGAATPNPNNGGGVFNLADTALQTATITAQNSIFANSFAANDVQNNQNAGTATVTASLPNIVESGIGNTGGAVDSTGVNAVDPMLQAMLTANGGPTLTFLPLSGSPAINTGNNAAAAALTNDQRGFAPRQFGTNVDLGAVEVGATAPAAPTFLVVGAGGKGEPIVKVYNADSSLRFNFLAYPVTFRGGVHVAVGDVNHDGINEVITAPGIGTAAEVKIFNSQTGALLSSFFAYPANYQKGVWITAGDVNNDGFDDVITGTRRGLPQVKVFNGNGLGLLTSFLAFGSKFRGGVRVAAGDLDNDGDAEIIATKGAGGGSTVRVFPGLGGAAISTFHAFGTAYRGGVFVAAGDVNNDGRDDIIVGAGAGAPLVRVFSVGNPNMLLHSFFAFNPGFLGGVRMSCYDRNGDGFDDLIVGAGSGGGPHVRTLDGMTLAQLDSFFAFNANFAGGVYVGGK